MLTHAQQRAVEEAVDSFIADGGDPETLLPPRIAESPNVGTVLIHGRALTSDWDDINPEDEGRVCYGICRSDGMWSPVIIEGDFSETLAIMMAGVTWADGRPVEVTDWPETVVTDSDFGSLLPNDTSDFYEDR